MEAIESVDLSAALERLASLRAQLDESRASTVRLGEEVAVAYQEDRDEEAERLTREKAESLFRAEALESAVVGLEDRIREEEARQALDGLQARLQQIAAKISGNFGEDVNRRRRLESLEGQVAEARQAIIRGLRFQALLLAEAEAISDRTGLALPSARLIQGPESRSRISRHDPPEKRMEEVLRGLEALGEDSPSLGLFESLGEPLTAWKERLEEERRERNQAQAARAGEERERVDAWLRQLLKDGPVARDRVHQRALDAGIPLSGSPVEADLQASRGRIGVDLLERLNDPGREAWWGRAGAWDEARFRQSIG